MKARRRRLLASAIGCIALLPTTVLGAPTPGPTASPTQAGRAFSGAPPALPTPPVPPTSTPAPVIATATPEPAPQPASGSPEPAAASATENVAQPADKLAYDTYTIWHGVVREAGAYRRAAPSAGAEILEELDPGTPVRVDGWVAGSMLYPDVITWGAIDPQDGGGYIFGGSLAGVLPPAVPPPPDDMLGSDRTWIDANLTLNVVTLYESGQPTKMMLMSPGRPGYETDAGRFSVYSKLYSQTMAGPGYSVPGVPSVQYFYGGEALHGRYWTLPDVLGQTSADVDDDGQIEVWDDSLTHSADDVNRGVAFGVPSSHGCIGLDVSAAAWLYSQTGYGTLVNVHY